jgi:hypothetical protein
MRLNCGEGNGVRLAGRTSQSIDRIDSIPIDTPICRYFLRSILHYAIDRADSFIDRSL